MQDRDGEYGAATVKLTNPNAGFWLPASDFVFAAKDASGGILGTSEGTISMAPSAIKDVSLQQISFGNPGAKVDRVEFQLRPQPFQPASSYPAVSGTTTNIKFIKSDYFSKVTGEVTNTSATNQSMTILCTLWAANNSFAGSASTSVSDMGPGVMTPFSALSLHSTTGARSATCYAQPDDFALNG